MPGPQHSTGASTRTSAERRRPAGIAASPQRKVKARGSSLLRSTCDSRRAMPAPLAPASNRHPAAARLQLGTSRGHSTAMSDRRSGTTSTTVPENPTAHHTISGRHAGKAPPASRRAHSQVGQRWFKAHQVRGRRSKSHLRTSRCFQSSPSPRTCNATACSVSAGHRNTSIQLRRASPLRNRHFQRVSTPTFLK